MVNERARTRGLILSRLRYHDSSLSGERFAEELGLSRVAVWKHIEALRAAGYSISADRSGYHLSEDGDFLYPWEFPGREGRILRREKAKSTMDLALPYALGGSEAIVVAEEQTRGRGRRGRRWVSERGGLYFTMVLSPPWPPERAQRAIMAAGVALCLAVREASGEEFRLEWPNDIVLGGRKAGGILAEYLAEGDSLRFIDIGVGVNVAKVQAGRDAISLSEVCGLSSRKDRNNASRTGRRALLQRFLDLFEVEDLDRPCLATEWEALTASVGKSVLSREGGSRLGRAVGIDDHGRILAENRAGVTRPWSPADARIDAKGKRR
jgi:BirA family biotin operon repressor/biotin-[acetyl-CoA-carboxylase] ligase